MRLGAALRAFWTVLTEKSESGRVDCSVSINRDMASEPPAAEKDELIDVPKSRDFVERSAALELLAALQRDARFIDFISESWDGCDDATVAAVARSTRDRCAATIDRIFGVKPLAESPEGEVIEVASTAARDGSRYRISGNLNLANSESRVSGRVVHSGWTATKVAVPKWRGSVENSMILAPIEIEL